MGKESSIAFSALGFCFFHLLSPSHFFLPIARASTIAGLGSSATLGMNHWLDAAPIERFCRRIRRHTDNVRSDVHSLGLRIKVVDEAQPSKAVSPKPKLAKGCRGCDPPSIDVHYDLAAVKLAVDMSVSLEVASEEGLKALSRLGNCYVLRSKRMVKAYDHTVRTLFPDGEIQRGRF